MYKNNKLILAAILLLGALGEIAPAYAQSEMDLLLFEKKNEDKEIASPKNSKSNIKVNTKSTLSDNLSKNAKKKQKNNDDAAENTEPENWLKSLIFSGKSKDIDTDLDDTTLTEEEEENLRVVLSQRKNAANFDISGIKLRMSPDDVNNILTKQGYKRISQNVEIPNFIKWRSEEMCRQHGVIGFERINACATRVAHENGYNFVERETYNRYSTKESIDVYYTSSFTNNLVHRIYYKSSVPLSDSRASNNVYINNLKIYDFWKRIDLKYGPPDNASEIKWGLGGKKPYLKAKTGYLELADPLLKDLDMARMFNEDTRLANTNYYTF